MPPICRRILWKPLLSVVLLALWVAPAVRADEIILVRTGDPILFKVSSKAKVLSCVGSFANTDGKFDGPFTSSIRVKFGEAAEGRVSPCMITVMTAGPAGQPPRTETTTIRVVAPTMRSRTLAHVPGSSDDRTTLGVGEEVMFTAQPGEMLLDSDVSWINKCPWNRIDPHKGLSTIYQAGFPSAKKRIARNVAEGSSEGGVSLFIKYCTDEITLYFGGASNGGKRDRNNAAYFAFADRHTPAALSAAYQTKLDRLEARFALHEFSTEPVAKAQQDDLHRQVPPIQLTARGFHPVLLALATLQTHPAGSTTGEQPEALKTREIRLVARMVFAFHQEIDPTYDLTKSRPDYFDPKLPTGATILPGHLNFEGRYRPEDIREPEFRRQFAQAIAENNAKMAYWDKQYRADDTDDTLRRFAWDYLQEICGRSDPQLNEFKRELIALGAEEKTAEALTKKPQELPVRESTRE